MLTGERGNYVCRADVAEVNVPATVQAAIEARIDRLTLPAKQTLNAASVIGARFGAELLAALGIDPVFDELLDTELIDQERFTPSAEYAFHHPLIRAVAYESQLKSDRAEWHRRLAAAIEERDPGIGRGERGADRRTSRVGRRTARGVWLADARRRMVGRPRCRRCADQLGAGMPDRRRAACRRPRPAADAHRAPHHVVRHRPGKAGRFRKAGRRFAELRELCNAAGDKVSLAIAHDRAGHRAHYAGRLREASRLASEQMALLESIGDPTLTVGLSFVAFINWFDAGEFGEILRWSQTVIDLAEGDPTRAPASVWDRHWRSRWRFAALPAGGWAVPDGAKTFTTPSRWRRDSDPTTCALIVRLDLRCWRSSTGCFGPTTPRCAQIEEALRNARSDPATISH